MSYWIVTHRYVCIIGKTLLLGLQFYPKGDPLYRIDIGPHTRSDACQQRRAASRSVRRINSQQFPAKHVGEHLPPRRVYTATTDEAQGRCLVVLIEQVERLANAGCYSLQRGVQQLLTAVEEAQPAEQATCVGCRIVKAFGYEGWEECQITRIECCISACIQFFPTRVEDAAHPVERQPGILHSRHLVPVPIISRAVQVRSLTRLYIRVFGRAREQPQDLRAGAERQLRMSGREQASAEHGRRRVRRAGNDGQAGGQTERAGSFC